MSTSLPYEVEIEAPPSKVWEFIIDPANYPTLNELCVEVGPVSTTEATGDIAEKRAWKAVESVPLLCGLYSSRVNLDVVATLEQPGRLLVQDIDPHFPGVGVRVTFLVGEGSKAGTTKVKNVLAVTAPWWMRVLSDGTWRAQQVTRARMIKDALEKP